MIEVVLFDVGGTLWPDNPYDPGGSPRNRGRALTPHRFVDAAATRLSNVSGLSYNDALVLASRLADDSEDRADLVQDTDGYVTEVVKAIGWADRGLDPRLIRRAMCIPARELFKAFPGTRELLAHVRGMGARVAVVSNAQWRDGEAYREDFRELGLADFVDAYVSSVDVGYRKPHESMFRVALDALEADPQSTVMVGNSVANDIVPAAVLGLRTILVAIQDEPPIKSPADFVSTSLAEVQRWFADRA